MAVSEVVHWWASRQRLGPPRTIQPHSEVVLVLGYPSRPDGRPNLLQRWRTEIAARSLDPQCPHGRLVFSGADPRAERSEAEVMGAYARDVLGVGSERIVLEQRARSTWENVEFSLGDLEGAEAIKVASDPLHALKARRYLWQQRPDLAARLVRAEDYRPLERWWLRFPLVVHASASWVVRECRTWVLAGQDLNARLRRYAGLRRGRRGELQTLAGVRAPDLSRDRAACP